MNNNRYNGWNNYETWRVNLECFDAWEGNLEAEEAREMIESLIEETTQESLARDYAMSFISNVDWQEIAEAHNNEEDEES